MLELKDRLYFKLTMIFLVIFMLSSSVLSFIIGSRLYRSITEQSFILQQEVSNNIRDRIMFFINTQDNKLSYINEIVGIGTLSAEEQERILSSILMQDKVFHDIYLIDAASGQEQIHLSRTKVLFRDDLRNHSGKIHLQYPIDTRRNYYSPVFFDERVQEPLLKISIPIEDIRSGKVSHILGVTLRFKNIWNILGQIPVPENMDVYVTDETGLVVAHKNPTVILQKTVIDVSNSDNQIQMSQLETVSLTSSFHLGIQEFLVITKQPFSQVYEPAFQSVILTIIITLLTILITLPLLLLISQKITKPVSVLVEAAQTISQNDFTVRIHDIGRNEIGYLSTIFNSMTEHLEKSQREVEQSTTEMEFTNRQLEITIERLHTEIAEREKAEKALIISNEKLNQSQKMDAIGKLAGGMAHDFNNVLSGILSASQLLKLPEFNVSEEGIEFVDMIIQASTRASDLISKLLMFSRKNKISSSVLDINKILDDTITILKSTIDKKISISVIKGAQNFHPIGDHSAIANVIINLGINASHAISGNGVIQFKTSRVTLNQDDCDSSFFDIVPGDFLRLDVTDTGCGIPQENLNLIFEPFYTTKEQGAGTGLGLSTVYGTIQDHYGAIEVESEPGVGTTFSIYLPSTSELIEQAKELKTAVKGIGTILIVDDEEMNRVLNKKIFESLGYKVLMAEDGLQSVSIFKERHHEIDIILMDMIMPKMNGSEAFYKMKEIDKDCKVIIASGYTRDENIDILIEDGLSAYISKPYKIAEISQILSTLSSDKSK